MLRGLSISMCDGVWFTGLTLELSGGEAVRLERVVRRPDAYHGDFNQ